MKKYIVIIIVLCGWMYSSCKREDLPLRKLAALNVINAVADQNTFYVNTLGSGVIWVDLPGLYFGSSQVYKLVPGGDPVSIVTQGDTLKPPYNQDIKAGAGEIYSLYMTGATAPYTPLLFRDTIPTIADSLAGVRFINLSLDSGPLSVNIQGDNNAQASALAFKDQSGFKILPAKMETGGVYTFEIRDAAGNVLTTYTWSFKLFFCQTLVIAGLQADGSLNVFSVNNF